MKPNKGFMYIVSKSKIGTLRRLWREKYRNDWYYPDRLFNVFDLEMSHWHNMMLLKSYPKDRNFSFVKNELEKISGKPYDVLIEKIKKYIWPSDLRSEIEYVFFHEIKFSKQRVFRWSFEVKFLQSIKLHIKDHFIHLWRKTKRDNKYVPLRKEHTQDMIYHMTPMALNSEDFSTTAYEKYILDLYLLDYAERELAKYYHQDDRIYPLQGEDKCPLIKRRLSNRAGLATSKPL